MRRLGFQWVGQGFIDGLANPWGGVCEHSDFGLNVHIRKSKP